MALNDVIAKLLDRLDDPVLRVLRSASIVQGRAADFPKIRNMAYCTVSARPQIVFAPKLLNEPATVQQGVLAHEFAHAYAILQGNSTHTEMECDRLARALFRHPLQYDSRDVQTWAKSATHKLRPKYLPNPGCLRRVKR